MSTHRKFKASLEEKGSDKLLELEWRIDKKYLNVKNNFKLYLDDIIDIQSNTDYLDLLTYILVNNKRERKIFSIRSNELASFEDELKDKCAPKISPHRPCQKAVDDRHYLVLINPFSGQKKAELFWAKFIQPLFDEMRLSYKVIRTERNGHAVEIIQKLDIENYVGVAVLSGDGLVSEVLNGILRRPDLDQALHFPLIHLPAGTSNALAAAIAYQSREPFLPRDIFCKELALMCSRPFYRLLSICHVQTAENGEMPMFMTASWGLMADIDLGSERFRWAGMIRLHIEAFIRIARLQKLANYHGRISYKPVEDKQILRNTLIKAEDIIKRLGKGNFFANNPVKLYDNSNEILKEPEECKIEGAFRGTQLIADENGKIPKLDEPVPDDWTTIEGNFVYVCLSSLSHLGSDLPYVPTSKLEEEVFYLTLVDWRVLKTRFHMGHLLITIDQNNHLDHTCLHIIPVTACRVEPAQNAGGYMAIDGEPCNSGTAFQVFSTKLKATVIGREVR